MRRGMGYPASTSYMSPMPLRMWILARIGHVFEPKARIRSGCLVTGTRLFLSQGALSSTEIA